MNDFYISDQKVLKIFNRFFHRRRTSDLKEFKELFERFQQILKGNNRVFELISELEDKLGGEYIFDINYLFYMKEMLYEAIYLIISNLNVIADNRYGELFSRQAAIQQELNNIIEGRAVPMEDKYIIDFDKIDSDMAELAGGKIANLGELRNRLKISTPGGFVISTAAYRKFLSDNELWPEIEKIYEKYGGDDRSSIENYENEIDRLFDKATISPDLAKAITRGLSSLKKRANGDLKLAVRSSAFGEDTHGRSFAGQFQTYLCRRSDEVLNCYKKVIASRFNHGVIVYRGDSVFEESELPMAVGIQEMIPAETAGTAYSVEPSGEFTDCLAISACYGLGVGVVAGLTNTDYFRISRVNPTRILWRRIGRKTVRMAPATSGGVESVPLPDNLQENACLTDEQIFKLAAQVLMLERYFKRPVDMEWCFDEQGKLIVLQCRPLTKAYVPSPKAQDRATVLTNSHILIHKKGQVAQRGIAAGKIKQVRDDGDIYDFPVGAIAVIKNTTPRLTSIIRSAAAIITDIGSPSGHMATVAREFGVPMIVGTINATELLNDGEDVTVDAEENIIYKGIIEENMKRGRRTSSGI